MAVRRGLEATPWGLAVSALCRSLEVGQLMHLQWLERTQLRCQEWVRRGQAPLSASDCLDLPLASMRWSLQEWDQLTQDLMSAALTLRGDWMMDHRADREPMCGLPEATAASFLDFCQQQMTRQSQAWADLLTQAGHLRRR